MDPNKIQKITELMEGSRVGQMPLSVASFYSRFNQPTYERKII